ncbi:hypothetical protein ID866_8238 [Astraeus odoratus]|nr:hypothetical protein ID866_8238 [Astraeus odoratus]
MVVFGLWVINKAGGLVYQRNFADGLAQLTSNEYLVLAGTLHGIHAITSRLSPCGPSSGAQVIEGESFKLTILLTATDHLSAEINNALSTQTSGSLSVDGRKTRQTISGVTIMSLKRGFTNEGDKILNYLEHGIFDAIQKQYLRKFIFAIYLDSHDPNNIIEAYTFNFRYYNIPGTNTVVPIMSLGDQLSELSLGRTGSLDPVSETLKRGKLPTLGEVKRSLKLFFNENTPDDYQPPHFCAGDIDSHKWFFATHKTSEMPEKMSIGNFETGWHGVNMEVTSVSCYLPSVTEDNYAMFTGITSNSVPRLTPLEEAQLRAEDAELQRKDALNRNVIWNADDEEASEEDMVVARYNDVSSMGPVGVRDGDGVIKPIPELHSHAIAGNPAQLAGEPQHTPTGVDHLIALHYTKDTQVIPDTQEVEMRSPSPSSVHRRLSLPPSDMCDLTLSTIPTQPIDTQLLEIKLRRQMGVPTLADIDMLDMETQTPLPPEGTVDPMDSADHPELLKTKVTRTSVRDGNTGRADSGKLDCDCGTVTTISSSKAFIATESVITDALGSTREITKKGKKPTRGKARKTQKELQRTRYVFLPASKKSKAYHDYFNPDPLVENRLMGLANEVINKSRMEDHKLCVHERPPDDRPSNGISSSPGLVKDSQTQETTHNVLMLAIARQTEATLKRKSESNIDKPIKKTKISIGTAVDLCD